MIKFEHTTTPSPEQMEFIIEGMRNPLDSWEKSDSTVTFDPFSDLYDYVVGDNDADLMERLKNAGTEHRKFMRMMPVMVRITAPLYWWKEFDTYKIGTVRNSCSTMHTLHKKCVTQNAFSHEWVDEVAKDRPYITAVYTEYLGCIENLRNLFNATSEKKYWYAMIQMLPDGFLMTANVSMNYETILNQMHQRAHHKQEEWSGQDGYLAWAKTLPYQFLFDEKKMQTFDIEQVSDLVHESLRLMSKGHFDQAYVDIVKAYTQSGGKLTDDEKKLTEAILLNGLEE